MISICAMYNLKHVNSCVAGGSVMDCRATTRGSNLGGNGVNLPSFTSFARDRKWGCRLYMTLLLKGRKTQTKKQIIEFCGFHVFDFCPCFIYFSFAKLKVLSVSYVTTLARLFSPLS